MILKRAHREREAHRAKREWRTMGGEAENEELNRVNMKNREGSQILRDVRGESRDQTERRKSKTLS